VSRARQAAALLALGALAAAAGYAGAAWLAGAASEPPAAVAAAAPAAPPEEALLTPPPPPPPPRPAPDAVPDEPPPTRPGPPAAEPEPAGEPEPPAPAPRPAPEQAPAPDPEPPDDPEPWAPAKPPPPPEPSPPPVVLEPPGPPPTGVPIPAAQMPTGYEPARRALATALAAAAPGSTEAADIRRGLALWREYLGPDAVSVPEGRRRTVARALRANAWWFAGRGSPAGRVILRDPDGILLTYGAGHGFAVNPVATGGRWRGLNDDVPPQGLAGPLLTMGAERAAGDRRFLAWEYHDVGDDPEAIRPGASAMAQGRVALVLAHAHARSGDPRYAKGALDALAAFTVGVDRGGVRSMVAIDPGQPPAPWYVERAYPGESPWKGAALNGFMVTLLNLRGAAATLDGPGDEPRVTATAVGLARDLADRGARTLTRHLADHDSGAWSYYGLMTPGRAWRTHLADLNYHCYHVRLLDRLARAYPELPFAATAARWQGYVDRAGASCPAR